MRGDTCAAGSSGAVLAYEDPRTNRVAAGCGAATRAAQTLTASLVDTK